METQDIMGEEDEPVNVNISHNGLADNLRPTEKTKINITVAAQASNVGPSFSKGTVLRDITNGPGVKVSGPKPSGLITRTSSGQKRPTKSPYDKSGNIRQPPYGPGRGRPPDPPNLNNLNEFPPNPSGRNSDPKLGATPGKNRAAKGSRSTEARAMEMPALEVMEEDGRQTTHSDQCSKE